MRQLRILSAVLTSLVLAGCGQPHSHGGKGQGSGEAHSDHAHERDKMLLTDAGKYHAGLTAHLSSKEGNELDIFLETQAKDPKPVAIPLESFDAEAKTAAGEIKPLKFEAAPADERPKDEKPGTCSHFVAKTPWLAPTEEIDVVAKLMLDGKEATIRWSKFVPKKYAHHED